MTVTLFPIIRSICLMVEDAPTENHGISCPKGVGRTYGYQMA